MRERVGGSNGLRVTDLSIRYGGIHAVEGVSLEAPLGGITGLIGPNGAGKTSTFNALSGLLTPFSGGIAFLGRDIAALTPQARAQQGLGRTFQRMELFDSLTVRDNVAVGCEAAMAGSSPWRYLFERRGEAAEIRARVEEAVEICGLGDVLEIRAGALSTGQRRLVELARAIAGPFRLLLLDEPSSGLDVSETEAFGSILKQLVAARGIGLLLVEHDMALVMDVCDFIYVIDFGRPIFEGTPAEVASSDLVRAAYLGNDDVEVLV